MGIRFIDSILVLLTAACAIATVYLTGHVLAAEEHRWAWIAAAAFAGAALLLGFVTIRRIRSYARSHDA